MSYNRKRKTKKNKHKKRNKHKNISNKAGVLNRASLRLSIPLETEHQVDGEIAAADVLEHLEGLPQDLPNEEHGIGADRRMKWLKDRDFEALLEDMKRVGINNVWRREQFKTPSLSKSNRQRYLNEIAIQKGLKPGGDWNIVKKRSQKRKTK